MKLHLPPQDLVAERSAIASLMLDSKYIDEISDVLRPEHFYADTHSTIYRSILRLHEAGKAVDVVTLAEELDARNKLVDVGGAAYLTDILEAVPFAAHAKYYADIVRDKWILRRLTECANETLRQAYAGSDDTDQVLQAAERDLFTILEQQLGLKKTAIAELLPPTLDRISERMEQSGRITGLPTGFRDLDDKTNGFNPGELVILAARPSMGKTALVCNIAEWVADAAETTTLIFSLEQDQAELVERFLCIRSRVDGHKLRKGLLDQTDQFALAEAGRDLQQIRLHIDDSPGRTVSQIDAICRRMRRRENLGLVIVDYLQLLEPEDRKANREQQVAQITRRLKAIAKINRIPVIALSQLNRGVDLREDKRPRLSDLRESGAIEQDADIVMFLHRPEAYDSADRPGLAEIIIAKHRSGPTGVVNLQWRKESMRFTDFEAGGPDFPDFPPA